MQETNFNNSSLLVISALQNRLLSIDINLGFNILSERIIQFNGWLTMEMNTFCSHHCMEERIIQAKAFAREWKDKITKIAAINMKDKKDGVKVMEELRQLATWARNNAEGLMCFIKGKEKIRRELRCTGCQEW